MEIGKRSRYINTDIETLSQQFCILLSCLRDKISMIYLAHF